MKTFSPSTSAGAERRFMAFTLIELMVVIAIIGLLAAVGLPALKGFGRANTVLTAQRQMLDAVAEARQRAIAERTEVFMVFVSPIIKNYLVSVPAGQRPAVSNILNKQFTGYALYAERLVGDQPGRKTRRYLTPWRMLPDGVFIMTNKFIAGSPRVDGASPFLTNGFPFPTGTNSLVVPLPYLKFNHLGQLVDPRDDGGEYIPLARGSVGYDINLNADVLEMPPGNSRTNSTTFNRVRIEGLTGRSRVERYEVFQ